MGNIGVGPEEPIFYGILLGSSLFLIYALWARFRRTRQRQHLMLGMARQKEAVQMELQAATDLLRTKLQKEYRPDWISKAFEGKIFEGMPLPLVRIAMGEPYDIQFLGNADQSWTYLYPDKKVLLYIGGSELTHWQELSVANE